MSKGSRYFSPLLFQPQKNALRSSRGADSVFGNLFTTSLVVVIASLVVVTASLVIVIASLVIVTASLTLVFDDYSIVKYD